MAVVANLNRSDLFPPDTRIPSNKKARLVLADGVTAPTIIGGAALIYVDSADGDLKVAFGDGTRKTIVVDT